MVCILLGWYPAPNFLRGSQYTCGSSSRGWLGPLAAPSRPSYSHASLAAEASNSPARQQSDVVIFTRAGCPFCIQAAALLKLKGIDFNVVDCTAEPHRRAEAEALSGGSTTVPQVFVGRRSLGGFDDIKRLDDQGTLSKALESIEEDGPAIEPTTDALLGGSDLVPENAREAFRKRADELLQLSQQLGQRLGSQPSFRAFLKYAVTGMPSQGQQGNVPLNTEADFGVKPLLPNAGIVEIGALLRGVMLQLLDEFVDPESGDVDYIGMRRSATWGTFLAVAQELANPQLRDDLLGLQDAAKKAFFLNLYNAMTFHGVVVFGRRPGLWNLYCFFIAPSVSYSLAGIALSLDDVENGILRRQPQYFTLPEQELQRQLQVASLDPRIHMALNCGARGCPAISVYSPAANLLDAELDEAVVAFVNDDSNVKVIASGGTFPKITLEVTELFKMYLSDFVGSPAKSDNKGDHMALASWIVPFCRGRNRELLSAALAPNAPLVYRPKVMWRPYDWSTNGPDLPLDDRIYKITW